MTHLTTRQREAAIDASRRLDPARPYEALARYLDPAGCADCARHTSGGCYTCQILDGAAQAAHTGREKGR